jgi:membrane associated rhomboid family serine protease
VKATSIRTGALRYCCMSEAATMYCYRHPNRETGVTCSECGRPICPDCMVFAPVGIRCPEHSGQPQGTARVSQSVKRASYEGTGALVTKALVAVNVGIYLLELGLGGNINGTGNRIYVEGVLYGPLVADGEWWRLFAPMFLHYGPLHLGLNMLALWWFGSAVEQVLGRGRFLLLYVVSGLAGSAGALLVNPNALPVGASGALFGVFGAAFVLERQGTYVFGGGALSIIVLNIVFSFAVPGISIGGHLGGLVGGAVGMLALSRFGRGHAVYGKPGLVGVAGLIGIGVLSLAVAFWASNGTLS